MLQVKLSKGTWFYDDNDLLGPPGGFGAVFRGRGPDGVPAAVKRLQTGYQIREMQIADFLLGHGLAHIIPILDAGFDPAAETNFIVMPIAETSLQSYIKAHGPVHEAKMIMILDAIASGLDEIGDIIHRDLKPGNVLLHDGVWKIADLGLARFAEATTSLNTMRDALTPSYAAPEQWRSERPQKATDIYALGCMIYALASGSPPFNGPTRADFSQQHQFEAPPPLDASPALKRLAATCLAKVPELRPSASALRTQIGAAQKVAKGRATISLAAASAKISEETSLRAAIAKGKEEQRKHLASEAISHLKDIFIQLEATVLRHAPNATYAPVKFGEYLGYSKAIKRLSLGKGLLDYGLLFKYQELMSHNIRLVDDVTYAGRIAGSESWDVLCGGYISVSTISTPKRGRSANLWFGQILEGDVFRWWEVCYIPSGERSDGKVPMGHHEDLGISLLLARVAEDPRPITPEFIDDFIERWVELFANTVVDDRKIMDDLFPDKVEPKPISEKFKVSIR